MPLMYERVRERIQDGDFLLFRGDRCFSRVIQVWTRSVYSHVGVALWLEAGGVRRLCCIEALEGRGVQILPMSRVLARDGAVDWFSVVAAPEGRVLDRGKLVSYALSAWGSRYASPWQFIRSFSWLTRRLMNWLGKPMDTDPDRFHCVEMIMRAVRHAGWEDSDPRDPAEMSPGDAALLPCLQRRGTLVTRATAKAAKRQVVSQES